MTSVTEKITQRVGSVLYGASVGELNVASNVAYDMESR
jgi:hypothetical protein